MASSPPIRIIVLGTGDFALPMFELLCDTRPAPQATRSLR